MLGEFQRKIIVGNANHCQKLARKLKYYLPYDPAFIFANRVKENEISPLNICLTGIYIATQIIVAKAYDQDKCQSTDD